MIKRTTVKLTQDSAILSKLGFPKINTYYWRRRVHIMELPINQPNMPGAWFGFTRGDNMILNMRPCDRFTPSEREKTLAKAALLLKDAKENGTYSQLMRMDVLDPRHPYYYEHPWQSALKMDSYSLNAWQRYKKWHCTAWRAFHDWDRMGLLYDDLWTPATQEPDPFLEEAICRLPYAQRLERERRLSRAYDMMIRREWVEEKDFTHPEDDVAYLMPYYNMIVDEHREHRDNAVDALYSR
jgi:hypothetical protein